MPVFFSKQMSKGIAVRADGKLHFIEQMPHFLMGFG